MYNNKPDNPPKYNFWLYPKSVSSDWCQKLKEYWHNTTNQAKGAEVAEQGEWITHRNLLIPQLDNWKTSLTRSILQRLIF